MAWTYSGDPASSDRDTVRFLVGDTVTTDPLATDEEIAWALGINSNVYIAASMIAESLATKFATMKVSVKIGPISEEYGNRAEFYAKRAKELKNNASANATLIPYAGGISLSDKEGLDSDNETIFKVGMDDNLVGSVTEDE